MDFNNEFCLISYKSKNKFAYSVNGPKVPIDMSSAALVR